MVNLQVKQFDLPQVNRKEWLRYAAVHGLPDENIRSLLEECFMEANKITKGKICYLALSKDDFYRFVPTSSNSNSLRSYLKDCSEVVVFAATIGIEMDYLIGKYASVSTVKSLLFQALGAERIENLCDLFAEYYQESEGLHPLQLKVRRSPGYGDFLLESQKELFTILQPEKHLGLTLTNSLMMTPTKSVSAIMGIQANDKSIG